MEIKFFQNNTGKEPVYDFIQKLSKQERAIIYAHLNSIEKFAYESFVGVQQILHGQTKGWDEPYFDPDGNLWTPKEVKDNAFNTFIEFASMAVSGLAYESVFASKAEVLFGQKSVSQFFSAKGKFKKAPIAEITEQLNLGTLISDDLPIEYIVRDGVNVTMNNRSLTALSQAGLKPSIMIDKTGNAFLEKQLTERLNTMGGSPSTSIFIRTIKETVFIP